ncbi:iron(III) transport system ATP-binding protein [Polaromonas sp. OV174]|uniref:ABC transporter ATP-binding protein n=1 Tax=Polaromonas sp. OV174 TaxID=1855300 RepID=UPI0008E62B17|nr:ABC transporter ATP-binding protein [Polaromonas sp. OV174]SFB77932.1 iron(III) transport system ATP-binding protein [Polaromonas sp. OV174]
MTSLDLHAVHKHYGPVHVLDGIGLSVAAGSRTAIVGPSGSGKTTLLRIIAGFEAPDAGRVTLGGQLLADGPSAVPAHKRGIGFVPQEGALFPHLTIADNVGFGLARNTPQRAERIAELMDMVALSRAMLARRPHELSGGQQQRVALARALAQRPRLMLLDEPFSALDTGLRASTRKAVATLLGNAGITTILVTHDQSEALSFADQVAVMREGRLVQAGPPAELYLRPSDVTTASFLGESIVLPAQLAGGWADCALGRIAVNDRQRGGAAQIMLRPEQLQVVQVPASSAHGTDASGCYGAVTDTDFGGSVCVLSVRLLRGSAAAVVAGADDLAEAAPLLVRTSALQVPPVGAMVRISVAGDAHVFSA